MKIKLVLQLKYFLLYKYIFLYDRKEKKTNENQVDNNRNIPQSNETQNDNDSAQIDVSIQSCDKGLHNFDRVLG